MNTEGQIVGSRLGVPRAVSSRKSTSEEPASPPSSRRCVGCRVEPRRCTPSSRAPAARHYMAPSLGCMDYVSLGCMVVEFVVGVCPFRTRDAAHWGGRKKKKKKKKQDTEDRALLKQAKKEMTGAGQHGARRARDGAGLDPGRLEGGPRSRREGVLTHCVEIRRTIEQMQLRGRRTKFVAQGPVQATGRPGRQGHSGPRVLRRLGSGRGPGRRRGAAVRAGQGHQREGRRSDRRLRFARSTTCPLSDGDFDTERWNYVSPDAYQAEVVWLLQWEEEKRGPRTRVGPSLKASSACAVSCCFAVTVSSSPRVPAWHQLTAPHPPLLRPHRPTGRGSLGVRDPARPRRCPTGNSEGRSPTHGQRASASSSSL